MNPFSVIIIVLFTLASIPEFAAGHTARAVFYLLSAGINLNVLFMR